MNEATIRKLLMQVKNEELNIDEACRQLKDLPYKDIGFANVDNHRALRTGFAEVVFCQGKTPGQIRDIMLELVQKGGSIMGTRATALDYEAVKEVLPQAQYDEAARIIAVLEPEADTVCRSGTDGCGGAGSRGTRYGENECKESSHGKADCDAPAHSGAGSGGNKCNESENRESSHSGEIRQSKDADAGKPSVAVVTAGTADIPVAEEAAVTAGILGNRVMRIYDVGVAGIHRLFDKLERIREADVVIVVAGMEGALASVVGGLVDVPVIAVPTSIGYGANLGGLSALLSMLNSCANGVGVVNIDNGFGAAYLAAVINRGKGK